MRRGRTERWKQGVGGCVVCLLLLAIPVGMTWRRVYVDRLNARLIAAVQANDNSKVIDLLARGADANARDDPPSDLSFGQRLLEMFHRKPSLLSESPSALYLALTWRPDEDSSIKLTGEDTPVIKALMDHGAHLNGPEILARMARIYAFCFSYQDTGTMSTTDPSQSLSFHTAFIRPGRFYFEYTRKPSERYVLWQNSSGVQDLLITQWGDRHLEKAESLNMGIAGATGVSDGVVDMAPGMLLPEQLGDWLPTNDSGVRLTGIKTVDGVACYEIVPSTNFITALYIDTKAFLLRKVVEKPTIGPGEKATLYHPQINVPLSESVFQFSPSK